MQGHAKMWERRGNVATKGRERAKYTKKGLEQPKRYTKKARKMPSKYALYPPWPEVVEGFWIASATYPREQRPSTAHSSEPCTEAVQKGTTAAQKLHKGGTWAAQQPPSNGPRDTLNCSSHMYTVFWSQGSGWVAWGSGAYMTPVYGGLVHSVHAESTRHLRASGPEGGVEGSGWLPAPVHHSVGRATDPRP